MAQPDIVSAFESDALNENAVLAFKVYDVDED